tara:strand:- start:2228 stop:2962 length:735 start_codon:yes stop_codon:yes gene_type:complete
MNSVLVLKTVISTTTVEKVANYLRKEKSKTVAICNSNTLVRSYRDPIIQDKINSFDVKAPDGFPVAKSSKILYKNHQGRVDGYNVFLKTIEIGISEGLTHYFYGSNKEVVDLMIKNLKIRYPEIKIAGFFCPPIRSYEELAAEKYAKDLIDKNADVVWVSLGFPKQEEFIYELRDKYDINSNLVGVGAVFEWVAKTKFKAPELMANLGLEWIIRLIQEPKRLFRRYLIDNFLFIIYFVKQYLSK